MKHLLACLAFALLWAVSSPLCAQSARMQSRLAQMLKVFPDADADKDGKLSMDEALKYLETHPQLKALFESQEEGVEAAKKVSSWAPAALSAPDASGLPVGPRVFVCGHSFMIYTSTLLPPLAKAAGIGYQDAGRQMISSSRVMQHWKVPDEQNLAKALLKEGKVDVLTLSPHVLLPDDGIDRFTLLGLERNPKLKVLVQASWPARDDDASVDFTNEKRNETTLEHLRKMRADFRAAWLDTLEKQVRELNAKTGREAVFIVPASEAVFALRERIVNGTAPGLSRQAELFRDALGHPGPALAALVTYCHFACIFGRSPAGLPVPAELGSLPQAEELNRFLQQLAWDAVTQYPMSGVKAEVKEASAGPVKGIKP